MVDVSYAVNYVKYIVVVVVVVVLLLTYYIVSEFRFHGCLHDCTICTCLTLHTRTSVYDD